MVSNQTDSVLDAQSTYQQLNHTLNHHQLFDIEEEQCELLSLSVRDVLSEDGSEALLAQLTASRITASMLLMDDFRAINERGCNLSQDHHAALQRAIRRRRLLLYSAPHAQDPVTPVVFTAPHTLQLLRDGHECHKREDYTGTLAQRWAEVVGGCAVTWTEQERRRVQRMVKSWGQLPDSSNRDPNFLKAEEVSASPWLHALQAAHNQMLNPWGAQGCMRRALHVDVHGCRDPGPSTYETDCMLGTAAMELAHGFSRAQQFRSRLEAGVRPLLQSFDQGQFDLEAGFETKPPALTGVHTGDNQGERRSLTQISTNIALFQTGSCFSHAVQVELSLRLRKFFCVHDAEREAFAKALIAACFEDE